MGNGEASSNFSVEGESSSDESDSEQKAYISGCQEVLQTAERILTFSSVPLPFSPHLSGWNCLNGTHLMEMPDLTACYGTHSYLIMECHPTATRWMMRMLTAT